MEVLVVSPSAVGRASDAAVEWDGLVLTWQTVFVGRASGGPSGRGATGDTLRVSPPADVPVAPRRRPTGRPP